MTEEQELRQDQVFDLLSKIGLRFARKDYKAALADIDYLKGLLQAEALAAELAEIQDEQRTSQNK